MKRLLMAGALAAAVMGQAAAADLPVAPPQAPSVYVPTVRPVYDWGGVYVGINGGYGFGRSEWTTPLATTGRFNTSGFNAGGTLGANYQISAFVFGIEGDLDWSGLQGTSTNCIPGCQTRNTWISTFRGRAGYAVDRVLFYGTGGGAYGNIQAGAAGATLTSTNKIGWTGGAGVEAAFTDNWTARAEYLFVDLQNATPFIATTVKLNANLVRFGVDYKFR
jgi:outer membrane immunogenic protein